MTNTPSPSRQIGFLGAGNMATALAQGILAAKLANPADLIASDPSADRRQAFLRATGVAAVPENDKVARSASLLLLAVKPQVADSVLAEIGPLLGPDQLFVSIAAGLSTAHIQSFLTSAPVPVVRVMPNTPALIRKGISALSPGSHATLAHLDRVRKLLQAVGEVVDVPESLMDAVTALSGSGPAYFFYFIEALTTAGVHEGLPPDVAAKLAKATALGAAELASRSELPLAELRRQVTSPGGTTEAALRILSDAGFDHLVLHAVHAATTRSKELGE